jgi:hypothetical protein
MKDLDTLCQFLEIEFAYFLRGHLLSQFIVELIFRASYFHHFPLELISYFDADRASGLIDHKSTTCFCIFFWRFSPNILSHSSIEAKHRVSISTFIEIVWLCWLHFDMGVPLSRLPTIYSNNKSTIQISHNSALCKFTKHIEIESHFICYHL